MASYAGCLKERMKYEKTKTKKGVKEKVRKEIMFKVKKQNTED